MNKLKNASLGLKGEGRKAEQKRYRRKGRLKK
jgi:hypothetical protein